MEGEDGTIMFHDSCENVKSYQWDFGDGTFDQSSNPSHRFERNGKYNVKLETSNASKTASSILTIEVTSVEPATYIIWGKNPVPLPIEVFIDDVVVGNITTSYPDIPETSGTIVYSATPGRHKLSARANGGSDKWADVYLNFEKGKTQYYYLSR